METNGVLIIGGGVAGLAAAVSLANEGQRVTILEARNRLGGRIHTITSENSSVPIELGAEFVHGAENSVWDLARPAGLPTHEVPDRHWSKRNGSGLGEFPFWDEIDPVLREVDKCRFDESFSAFLQHNSPGSPEAQRLATTYIEGFHAADAGKIGVRAIALSEAAAEASSGMRQFRIQPGYSEFVKSLTSMLDRPEVSILTGHSVTRVRWEPGKVEVFAESESGPASFQSTAAIITLPLGVLKRLCESSVTFDPPLTEKRQAIQSLEMGQVVKVVFEFRSRFWPTENFGFIHAPDSPVPTWWSDERGHLLTAWAGGAQADRLAEADGKPERLLDLAADLFGADPAEVRSLLVRSYTHDWRTDPRCCGAYSYAPAGMMEMPELLAVPLAGTLYFAGEATDAEGNQGTVHGAINSGRRAASELLESL